MLATQRHAAILQAVLQKSAARITELSDMLNVSEMTIRRDIESLADQGLVEKVHGGVTAIAKKRMAVEPPFQSKSLREQLSKDAIAARASLEITPGSSIALMGGSSVFAVAKLAVTIPGLTIVDPCDALDLEQAVPQIAEHQGPVYMRLQRGNVPLVLDEYNYKFELGKAKTLRDGKDILIISSGFMTMRSLEVAQQLAADKVDVAVLHVPTIKPLDTATILKEVSRPGRLVVVAENHSVIGGLGEAVASLLMLEGVHPQKFKFIGLPDAYLDAGALPTLHDRYGISAEKMGARLKAWLI